MDFNTIGHDKALFFLKFSCFLVPIFQVNDPSQQNAQAATKFLPLLIGYFALSVPSGLSLYWLAIIIAFRPFLSINTFCISPPNFGRVLMDAFKAYSLKGAI